MILKKIIKKSIKQKKLKAFTFIEVMVAVAVFSIAMVAVTDAFVTIIKSYRIAKQMQLNIEQTEYALTLIGKTLRTSEIDSSSTHDELHIFDPSQGKCIIYKIDNDNKLKWASSDSDSPTQLSDCNFGNMNLVEFINSNVSGSFNVSNDKGKVTINLTTRQGSKSAHFQTTVSLRN